MVPGAEVGRFYDRECDLGILNDLTGRLGAGAGGAVVVRGEPGIGKSALTAVPTCVRAHGKPDAAGVAFTPCAITRPH